VLGLLLGVGLWVAGLALYRNSVSLRGLLEEAGFEDVAELTDEVHDFLGGHRPAQRIERAVQRIGQALTVVVVLATAIILLRRRGRGAARSARGSDGRDEPDWLGDRRN
jgi:hypothetical protein